MCVGQSASAVGKAIATDLTTSSARVMRAFDSYRGEIIAIGKYQDNNTTT